MATEFKLPDLGENVEAGEVINVLVAVGDSLEEDQPVIELETDKAVIEVPSSVSGTIAEIMVSEGDTAAVGEVILTVEGSAGGPGQKQEAPARKDQTPAREVEAPQPPVPRQPPSPAGDAAASRPIEVKLPALGEGIESGDIVAVLVSPGSDIAVDDPVLEIEIDKGVVEMPSPLAGKVTAVHVSEGDKAAVGQLVLTLESDAPAPESGPAEPLPAHAEKEGPQAASPAPPPAPVPAPAPPAGTDTPAPTKLVPAAPSVRRLAREIGVDIAEVRGTGPGGRISADDVKAHSRALNSRRAAAPAAPGAQAEAAPLPDFSKWGDVERKPMSNVRRVTARHMASVWGTIPHVTQFDKADVTDLEAWRR
ncbi:MAG: E3 binding domain-containing protein, partial [Gemmatimonadetes bacterium]|nr:E3 binding domain-containing protein [Gemmatimonadota bacterium]